MKKRSSKEDLKKLRSQLYWAKKETEEWITDYRAAINKVEQYSQFINEKFSWFVDILAEGETPNLPSLIKNIKDFLVRIK